MTQKLKGQTALITGASGGIGAAIARELAARGANVVLSARGRDKLEALATELRAAHNVETHVFAADLAEANGPQDLVAAVETAALSIDILVNNAGLGAWGPFADMDWSTMERLIDVDIRALTYLTAHFVPAMRSRGRGRVMNMSSFLAFVSCPSFAIYSAAKAYVRNLSEAIDVELKGTGVRVIAVCPGGTRTQFSDVAGQRLNAVGERSLMEASAVAKLSVKKMLAGRRTYIPGWLNVLTGALLKIIPRTFRPGLMRRVMALGLEKTSPRP